MYSLSEVCEERIFKEVWVEEDNEERRLCEAL